MRTALIGAGRLARALAALLPGVGYPVVAVAARRTSSGRRLTRTSGIEAEVTDPVAAAGLADLVLLAVPDGEIETLAVDLAHGLGPLARPRVFLHHAGRLGTGSLAPLARSGGGVAVLHPLQTLAGTVAAASLLPGSHARLEGRGRGLRVARRLARDLGLIPLKPAADRGVTDRDRALYHAAASLAANDLLALLDAAAESMERAGFDRRQAGDALLTLMQGALSNTRALGLERALTGPVVRGDREALAAHLRHLRAVSRDTPALHALLSARLVRLARRSKRLGPGQARALNRLLREVAGSAKGA